MNIVVCIKQVPNTNEVKLDPVTGTLIREGVPSIINPDDKAGLEAALRLKDSMGAHVTVLSMGPPQADAALREALAEADIPFDKKPFVPHITLIRRLRAPVPLCPRLDQAEMEASKAALMCSSFTGGKVQYQEI